MNLLVMEMFRVKHGLASEVFESMFVINNISTNYAQNFCVLKVNTEYFGKHLIRYLGLVIWNSLSWEIKSIATLSDFNESRKKWICKNYISRVGFVTP